jgi:type III restriction enzyme
VELKNYQRQVITDVRTFLDYLERSGFDGSGAFRLRAAFRAHWNDKGATGMEDYKDNVRGVPHVCIKVPTAGGKTFIAANALRPVFEFFARIDPTLPKVVIWLVPSLTILDQTIKNLRDTAHPYRQKLNTHFNGRVEIYDKGQILQAANFNADAVREQLNIIVLSFDSLRARKKEDRKIFQENSYLESFTAQLRDKEHLLPEHDETALINVLRGLRPLVIVDESHNAESDLSVEMLANLNPRFILDLTATPRKNSNIVSFVNAAELKKQHMVKLPVIVRNQADKTEVLQNALLLRRKLEEAAEREAANGGSHVRPIVLLQAQPRTGEDNTTFERIKEKLIELRIPEEQIKIKTGYINELKDVDLLSRDCPVRFIITVNALKEGWDCPFAYVLASLANKSSVVDVEQILGRVLRQPYVREHQEPLLNMSYVLTASNDFLSTLNKVTDGLNSAGFSQHDYRAIDENGLPDGESARQSAQVQQGLFTLTEVINEAAVIVAGGEDAAEDIDVGRITLPDNQSETANTAAQAIEAIAEQAVRLSELYEQSIQQSDTDLPQELEGMLNKQPMKEIYLSAARQIRLPQFFIKVEGRGGFFDQGENHVLLESNHLLGNFRLNQCDIDIPFSETDTDMYAVDLEEVGKEDYKPTFRKLNTEQRTRLNEFILSQSQEAQFASINNRLCDFIGDLAPIPDKDLKAYIQRILEQMTTEQLHDCLEHDLIYGARIKQKIKELTSAYKEKQFANYLDVDKIFSEPNYTLPPFITPSVNAPAITKTLYASESGMNPFEQMVANEIANLENVLFWHKNIEGKGFVINGFINHYPDFIVQTKNGKTLLVESKGDHLDNSESARKLKLGQLWAGKSGNAYRYFMVFDTKPIVGADRLTDAIKRISQM